MTGGGSGPNSAASASVEACGIRFRVTVEAEGVQPAILRELAKAFAEMLRSELEEPPFYVFGPVGRLSDAAAKLKPCTARPAGPKQ